jgi:TonB family protein
MLDTSLHNLGVYVLQVALLVSAAGLAASLLRLAMPRARLTYWRLVVVACLLLPLAPVRHVDVVAPAAPIVTAAVLTGPALAAPFAGPAHEPSARTMLELLPWVLALGIAGRGLWLGLGFLRLRRLRGRGEPAQLDEDIMVLQRALAPHAELRWHERLSQPVTFGLRHPVVLLPSRLGALPLDIQRAVVCHELLHVGRRDWLWTLIEEAVRTFFWFHPPMRWALAQVQLSREETVDTLAVAITGARRSYMNALMMFAPGGDDSALAPAILFVRRRQLVLRMQAISQEVPMSPLRLTVTGIALVGALVASSLGIVSALPLHASIAGITVASRDVPLPASVSSPAATAESTPRAGRPRAAQDKQKYTGRVVSFDFRGADLRVVLRTFSDFSGRDIIIDPSVHGTVDVSFHNVPWDQGLDMILRANKLRSIVDGSALRITPMAEPTAEPAPARRVIREVKPQYPVELLRFGLSAEVTLKITINAAGDVIGAEAASWSMRTAKNETAREFSKVDAESTRTTEAATIASAQPFVDEAKAAARQWKFTKADAETIVGIVFTFTTKSKAEVKDLPGSVDGGIGGVVGGVVGGIVGGVPGGVGGGVPGGVGTPAPTFGATTARPGEVPPPKPSVKIVRVGGTIKQPVKIVDVKPIYPEEARAAGVQGVVIIELQLATDGSVADARILRSIPMLDEAALGAARQWRFLPTLLNGEPVELVMTVTINFRSE